MARASKDPDDLRKTNINETWRQLVVDQGYQIDVAGRHEDLIDPDGWGEGNPTESWTLARVRGRDRWQKGASAQQRAPAGRSLTRRPRPRDLVRTNVPQGRVDPLRYEWLSRTTRRVILKAVKRDGKGRGRKTQETRRLVREENTVVENSVVSRDG